MRELQGRLPRMKDRFKYEDNWERKATSELVGHSFLFNLRCPLVKIMQIRNTYMIHLSVKAKIFLRETLEFYSLVLPGFGELF